MDSQDQDMYFTNLLSGNSNVRLDDSPPSNVRLNDSPPSNVRLDDSPPLPLSQTNVRKSIRGVNFIPEEDKLVVSAWLNCSLDAVQGTDQKHSQFWEKIYEYFQQFKETTTERTIKSLSNRWSCIQKATNSFCACLSQVERLNQSGITEHDKIDKAKIMYQSQEKCNFQFEHCWNLLKEQPKWISRPTKDVPKHRKVTIPSRTPNPTQTPSPTRNVIVNEVIELDRPMGRKAEKRKRKPDGKQTEENKQLRKMKFTLLEESHAQEKFIALRLRRWSMTKDKEETLRLQAEKLRNEAQKTEIAKKESEEKLRIEAEKVELAKKESAENLRIEAEKTELAKKESDQRIMMMDVSGMAKVQRLYFEELQREIIKRHNLA